MRRIGLIAGVLVGAILTIAVSAQANVEAVPLQWLAPLFRSGNTVGCTTATDSVAGCMSGTDHTALTNAVAAVATKANTSAPQFTGAPRISAGGVTGLQIDRQGTFAGTEVLNIDLAIYDDGGAITSPQGRITLTGDGNYTAYLCFALSQGGTYPQTPRNVLCIYPNGDIAMPYLPSSAPAGGSKKLWYDGAAGNVIKYVP